MTKEKLYDSVYRLVNDYYANNHKQPKYLFINSDFDLTTYLDSSDLREYFNDHFKGMMIVRTSEVTKEELAVH
jgi:hypothetical protein